MHCHLTLALITGSVSCRSCRPPSPPLTSLPLERSEGCGSGASGSGGSQAGAPGFRHRRNALAQALHRCPPSGDQSPASGSRSRCAGRCRRMNLRAGRTAVAGPPADGGHRRLRAGRDVCRAAALGTRRQTHHSRTRQGRQRPPLRPRPVVTRGPRDRGLQLLFRRRRRRHLLRWQTLHPRHQTRRGRFHLRNPHGTLSSNTSWDSPPQAVVAGALGGLRFFTHTPCRVRFA